MSVVIILQDELIAATYRDSETATATTALKRLHSRIASAQALTVAIDK